MTFVVIIVLVLILAARKNGRLKLVLSPEEAQAIKAHWWEAARIELQIWAACFSIAFAIFAEPLADMHWPIAAYVSIAVASLLLFSRLAIWGTLILGLPAWCIGAAAEWLGHPVCPPIYVMGPIMAATSAILVRCVITLVFAQPSQVTAQPDLSK